MLIVNAYWTFTHAKYLVYNTKVCNVEHKSFVWVGRREEALHIQSFLQQNEVCREVSE